jgi:NADH-quinone oxidoreductase subunit M
LFASVLQIVMDFLRHHLLSFLIFLPAAGAIAVLFIPRRSAIRWTALGVTLAVFLGSLLLLFPPIFDWRIGGIYDYAENGGIVQMVQRADWIRAIGAQYLVAIDGLSLPMVLLTAFLFVLACGASWKMDRAAKAYWALLLLLEAATLGTFLAFDFLLFFTFTVASLAVMFFLIRFWGESRRQSAAWKWAIYSLIGVISLLAVLILARERTRTVVSGGTLDLVRLAALPAQNALRPGARWMFLLAALAFFSRMPAIGLHGWLPEFAAEAPAAVGMLLFGVLLSAGSYGLLRVAYALFPQAAEFYRPLVLGIGILSLLHGAFCALGQTEFKRVLGFAALSQMGFVTLGIGLENSASLNGAIYLMVAFGLSGAAMFAAAAFLQDRVGRLEFSRLGGIAAAMPIGTGLTLASLFAAIGLPGFAPFIGKLLVILGSQPTPATGAVHWLGHILSILLCLSIVLIGAYLLRSYRRMFLGPNKAEFDSLRDLDPLELSVLIPLTVALILLGILPWIFFFGITGQSAAALLRIFAL